MRSPVRGRTSTFWLAALAGTFALIMLVNPVGFAGGGGTTGRSQCRSVLGGSWPLLPHDHWQSRWPVIAPIAGMIALFGESDWRSACQAWLMRLAAFSCWLGSEIAWQARRSAMWGVGPAGHAIFGVELLGPNAEHPELFFLLLAANFILAYVERQRAWLALAAGLSWSLAFQVGDGNRRPPPAGHRRMEVGSARPSA